MSKMPLIGCKQDSTHRDADSHAKSKKQSNTYGHNNFSVKQQSTLLLTKLKFLVKLFITKYTIFASNVE